MRAAAATSAKGTADGIPDEDSVGTGNSPDLLSDANVGQRVELFGLVSRADLNGKKAIITSLDCSAGRYSVELEELASVKDAESLFLLKPQNLKFIDFEEEMPEEVPRQRKRDLVREGLRTIGGRLLGKGTIRTGGMATETSTNEDEHGEWAYVDADKLEASDISHLDDDANGDAVVPSNSSNVAVVREKPHPRGTGSNGLLIQEHS